MRSEIVTPTSPRVARRLTIVGLERAWQCDAVLHAAGYHVVVRALHAIALHLQDLGHDRLGDQVDAAATAYAARESARGQARLDLVVEQEPKLGRVSIVGGLLR